MYISAEMIVKFVFDNSLPFICGAASVTIFWLVVEIKESEQKENRKR